MNNFLIFKNLVGKSIIHDNTTAPQGWYRKPHLTLQQKPLLRPPR